MSSTVAIATPSFQLPETIMKTINDDDLEIVTKVLQMVGSSRDPQEVLSLINLQEKDLLVEKMMLRVQKANARKVPEELRCNARNSSYVQCSGKKSESSEFCKKHVEKRNFGVVGDPIPEKQPYSAVATSEPVVEQDVFEPEPVVEPVVVPEPEPEPVVVTPEPEPEPVPEPVVVPEPEPVVSEEEKKPKKRATTTKRVTKK